MVALPALALPRTANDRLKEGFEIKLALSLMAALVLHVLVFELWPAMEAPGWNPTQPPTALVPAPPVDLPPPPAALPRPAAPSVSATLVADQTIPVVRWDAVVDLPAPPPPDPVRAGDAVPFTPYTVPPSLANPAEVQRALEREYPVTLRDAGVGGTVALLVHIDAGGRVLEVRVGGSSGMATLDAAALAVADVFRFRPALNFDRAVEVWIRLPVTFRVR